MPSPRIAHICPRALSVDDAWHICLVHILSPHVPTVSCPGGRRSCEQTNPTVSCLFAARENQCAGTYHRDATNMTSFPFHFQFNPKSRAKLVLVRSQLERGEFFRRVTEHDSKLLTSIDIQSICILSPVHLACNEHLIGAPLPLRLCGVG